MDPIYYQIRKLVLFKHHLFYFIVPRFWLVSCVLRLIDPCRLSRIVCKLDASIKPVNQYQLASASTLPAMLIITIALPRNPNHSEPTRISRNKDQALTRVNKLKDEKNNGRENEITIYSGYDSFLLNKKISTLA